MNTFNLLNEFCNAASIDNYLFNIAFTSSFKDTFTNVLSSSTYNYVFSVRTPIGFLGGDVSMLPTSSIYNAFSSSLSKKEGQLKNLIKAVKGRLSVKKIAGSSRNKDDQYIIEFKPFRDSKYFESINSVVREMVIDMNMNFEISKSESAAKFFDRYLDESNNSYLSSTIGQTSKLISCSISVLKSILGNRNSTISMPEITIKYSDNISRLLLAMEKGAAHLPDSRF